MRLDEVGTSSSKQARTYGRSMGELRRRHRSASSWVLSHSRRRRWLEDDPLCLMGRLCHEVGTLDPSFGELLRIGEHIETSKVSRQRDIFSLSRISGLAYKLPHFTTQN